LVSQIASQPTHTSGANDGVRLGSELLLGAALGSSLGVIPPEMLDGGVRGLATGVLIGVKTGGTLVGEALGVLVG
jgi:hypothetical protein